MGAAAGFAPSRADYHLVRLVEFPDYPRDRRMVSPPANPEKRDDMTIQARPVSFTVQGDRLAATFYTPDDDPAPKPCVVLGHGWSMVAGGDLEDYARAVVRRGLCALTFDYRNLGNSEGEPRQHIDPWKQVEDFRAAISFVRTLEQVDGDRIGIWGSSYGGGHTLTVTALDSRVKCTVSQVPTIDSWRAARGRLDEAAWAARDAAFLADREAAFRGEPMQMIATISDDPGVKAAYPDAASFSYMSGQGKICPAWRPYTTVASLEAALSYVPGAYLHRIAETPLLMVIADSDTTTPTHLQREGFEQIKSATKKLLEVPGGHYSVYQEHFDTTSGAAADWFETHLVARP